MGQELVSAKFKTWIIHGLFFAFFLSLALVNFLNFRLPALDQGIANQALYSFAHLNNAVCSLLIDQPDAPYLSLHLSLWVPILSPFYYLFGFYTLFLFQAGMIVFAGYYLYKIARFYGLSDWVSCLLLLQFYTCWAWIGAFADGYHENCIAACLVPFLFWSFLQTNKLGICMAWLGMIICKENMAIWLFFLIPVLSVSSKKYQKLGVLTLVLMAASAIYFYVTTQIFMPALDPSHRFQQLNRYSHLGASLTEIGTQIVMHPLYMLELFFKSHVQPDELENMKWELWMVLLFSGFWTIYVNPVFSIAFLPLLAQKLWNKEVVFWGINHHYNVEFAPLLALLLILYIHKLKSELQKKIAAFTLLAATVLVSLFVLFERKSIWYDQEKDNYLLPSHYQSRLATADFEEIKQAIPATAALSTNSSLVPHFCDRLQIYMFPNCKKAEYLLLLNSTQDTYPLSSDMYLQHKFNFATKDSLGYKVVASNESFTLFQKK